jgi:hypothetical protein
MVSAVFYKLLISLALPRGQRQANKDNHLAESGTPKHSTGSFGFLPRVSHQDAAGESKPHSLASTLVVIVAPAPRRKQRYLGMLISGEWMGTMQLTEPQVQDHMR